MKTTISKILIAILLIGLMVSAVGAESFSPSGSDVTYNIDTNRWYVFTPDNLENNPELAEIGANENELKRLFDEEGYITVGFANASGIPVYFEITKVKESEILNLTPHTQSEITRIANDLIKDLRESVTISDHSIYEGTYKYIIADYTSENSYFRTYITVVNGESYWFKFYADEPLNDTIFTEAKKIIDSATFQVENPDVKETTSFKAKNLLIPVGAAVAAGAISSWLRSRKNKKNQQTTEQ